MFKGFDWGEKGRKELKETVRHYKMESHKELSIVGRLRNKL